MNIPILLILTRIILSPVVYWAILFGGDLTAAFFYAVGLLTDSVDGKVARDFSLTSPFQEGMDSPADKLLVAAAMIGLMEIGRIDSILVFLFILREFLILGMRGIQFGKGNRIMEINENLGRIRFFILHLGLLLLLFPAYFPSRFFLIANLIVLLSIVFSFFSFVYYLWKDRDTILSAMNRR